MQHSAKYLIHAEVRTDGVVERSDVVGAVFGQTEGLLGEDMDLRALQESSKVGRIDVEIDAKGGRSYGTITVASGLDRVETAVLAASFETIERVGPCRAECTVVDIEDVRAAKREQLVDRASQLLAEFEETTVTGESLVDEVRQRARASEITEVAGLPAGPRVEDSDAIIVVEGRADVRTLLEYGIKNGIAVEGTDVPEAVASLTNERTTTAFLDGDRGGDLIVRELGQVGAVDYVAFAPNGQSVEDLDRIEVQDSLRRKLPFDQVADGTTPREAFAPESQPGRDDGVEEDEDASTDDETGPPSTAVTASAHSASQSTSSASDTATRDVKSSDQALERVDADSSKATSQRVIEPESPATDGESDSTDSNSEHETVVDTTSDRETEADSMSADATDDEQDSDRSPETLAGHVSAVIGASTDHVRALDEDMSVLAEQPIDETVTIIEELDPVPRFVVLDAPVSQRILDVAAQRGVGQVVGTDTDEFVKRPTGVRVRTADELQ